LKTEEPMNPPQRKRTRLEFLLIVEPDFGFPRLELRRPRRFGSPLTSNVSELTFELRERTIQFSRTERGKPSPETGGEP
jgi:hypothetical protein